MSNSRLVGILPAGERLLVKPRIEARIKESALAFIPDALELITEYKSGFNVITVTFDRDIGLCWVVKTDTDSEVFYAKRRGLDRYSRFVIDGEPFWTSQLTIMMVSDSYGNFQLVGAYCGPAAPPEPEDRNATEASLPFWNRHAFVFGSEEIDIDSETKWCPWPDEVVS